MTRAFDLRKVFADVRAELSSPTCCVSWAAATLILSLIAPFNMAETTSFVGRLIYWFFLIGAALSIAVTLISSFNRLFPSLKMIYALPLIALIFAITFTPLIYLANYILFPNRLESLSTFPEMLGFVLLVFLCMTAVITVIRKQYVSKEPEPAKIAPFEPSSLLSSVPEPSPQPQLVKRLEYPLNGARIIRLSMQDHYVEVHTDHGSQLILMRMSDAIAELDGVAGLQVHRSHWVALDAVTGNKREKGRLYVLTNDGAAVPVSRSFTPDVREAGLV